MQKGLEGTLDAVDEMLNTAQRTQRGKTTTSETTVSVERMEEYESIGSAIFEATQIYQDVLAKLEDTRYVPTEIQNAVRQSLKEISERLKTIDLDMKEVDNPSDSKQYSILLKVNIIEYQINL